MSIKIPKIVRNSKIELPYTVHYLFAVALSFLPRADGVKCRYEVHRAVGKVLAAGHRRLMDSQRIRVLEYGVTVSERAQTKSLLIQLVCLPSISALISFSAACILMNKIHEGKLYKSNI